MGFSFLPLLSLQVEALQIGSWFLPQTVTVISNLLEVDSENFNNLKLETNLLYQNQSKERREKGQGLNKPIAKKKQGKNQKEKNEAMESMRKNEVQGIEGLLKKI